MQACDVRCLPATVALVATPQTHTAQANTVQSWSWDHIDNLVAARNSDRKRGTRLVSVGSEVQLPAERSMLYWRSIRPAAGHDEAPDPDPMYALHLRGGVIPHADASMPSERCSESSCRCWGVTATPAFSWPFMQSRGHGLWWQPCNLREAVPVHNSVVLPWLMQQGHNDGNQHVAGSSRLSAG
mmetsp:Transcript_75753/g.209025  ORF Transcript_75753/g.209025 Transcript_75753/m.209025 type:complete len:184 (-) Transcript_75753:542-1093(-)